MRVHDDATERAGSRSGAVRMKAWGAEFLGFRSPAESQVSVRVGARVILHPV